MEHLNTPSPSPNQLASGRYQVRNSPVTRHQRQPQSREYTYIANDRPALPKSPGLTNGPGTVPLAPKSSEPRPIDVPARKNGRLRRKGLSTVERADHGGTISAIASPSSDQNKGHEIRSLKIRVQRQTTSAQPSDDNNCLNNRGYGICRKTTIPLTGGNSPVRISGKSVHRDVSPTSSRRRADHGIGLGIERCSERESFRNTDASAIPSTQHSGQPMQCQSSLTVDFNGGRAAKMPPYEEVKATTEDARPVHNSQPCVIGALPDGKATFVPEILPSLYPTPARDTPNILCPATPSQANCTRYFSPGEIGLPTNNITQKEPLQSQRMAYEAGLDGSFLGCKANSSTNGKGADNVLIGRQNLACVSPAKPGAMHTPPDTRRSISLNVTQKATHRVSVKGGSPASQSLKNAPCPRPSPKASRGMENLQSPSTEAPIKTSEQGHIGQIAGISYDHEEWKACHSGDDVFTVIPTTRHAMITVGYNTGKTQGSHRIPRRPLEANHEGSRPQMGYIRSELRRATQDSQKKSTASSKVSLKDGVIGSTLVMKDQPTPGGASRKGLHVVRGYIRTSGMTRPPTQNLSSGRRNGTQRSAAPTASCEWQNTALSRSTSDSSQPAEAYGPPNVCPPESPVANGHAVGGTQIQLDKNFEIAELDGSQADNGKLPQNFRLDVAGSPIDSRELSMPADSEDEMGDMTLSLAFDILFLSAAHIVSFFGRYVTSTYVENVIRSFFQATAVCFHSLRYAWRALTLYATTGSWPKLEDKAFSLSLRAVGQFIVNVAVLGFFIVILGQVAWYAVLVGSWIIWLARPFAWLLSIVGRTLLS